MTVQQSIFVKNIGRAIIPCQRYFYRTLFLTVAFFLPVKGWSHDELNLHFLQGGDRVRMAAFLGANAQYYPGRYFVDVIVNGTGIGKRVLTVTSEEQRQLCFTPEWLANAHVSIRADFFARTFRSLAGCYALGEQSDTEVNFDTAAKILTLTLPPAGLTKADSKPGWQYGNNALRLNYNANANKYQNGTSYFGSTSLLANAGEWVIRGNASVSQGDSSIDAFTLSKALLDLQSDMILGKTTVSSGDLGGLSTYGVTLASNNAMGRQTRGYTPLFSGIATSTARVTLQQGNTTLYSELVAPGPFTINDVTVFTGGDVVMTVTENDGSQTQQVFPITLIQDQISPGQHEYSASLGATNNNNAQGTPKGGLAAFNYGYGFPGFSVRTGTLLGNKFVGVTGSITSYLGVYGSISANHSATRSRYPEGNHQGQKRTLTYAKTFQTGTSIRTSYGQISQFYNTLGEYNDIEYTNLSRRPRLKENINISLSQPLWQRSSFSIGGWERRFWGQRGSQQGVNSSFSTRLGQVNLSFSGSYYKTQQEDQYSVSTSVSIPFSVFEHDLSTFATLSNRKNSGSSYFAGASANVTDRWSLTASNNWSNDSNISRQTNLWSNYSGNKAQLNGQLSHADYGTTGSGSISGSMLYLPIDNSVILGRNISDTVAVVNVKNTSGVTLLGRTDTTDRNGNLLVPLTSYQVNTLTLNTSSLPASTELSITSQKIKPTGMSVAYVPFEPLTVKRYVLQIRKANGDLIPPGVWATTDGGTPLGFVGAQGVLLINSVDLLGTLLFPGCHVPASVIAESSILQEVRCVEP